MKKKRFYLVINGIIISYNDNLTKLVALAGELGFEDVLYNTVYTALNSDKEIYTNVHFRETPAGEFPCTVTVQAFHV